MKTAIVVGSGAGGAAAAKDLQGSFAVTILEAGESFHPLSLGMPFMEKLKGTGLLLDERLTGIMFPPMKVRKTREGMVLVNGVCVGGTTVISAGNALRMDQDLRKIGIDLDAEFDDLYRDIPVSTAHQRRWGSDIRQLFGLCGRMGLDPGPTPKLIDDRLCRRCGRCILGCPTGAKWDSRRFIEAAIANGTRLITGCRVERIAIENGKAKGVWARQAGRKRFFEADTIVLAAGGFETPVILANSGLRCQERLFVDPVLCVAARRDGCGLQDEIPMPFVIQRPSYIVAPYFDYLSFFFNRRWRRPASGIISLMIKLADSNLGGVGPRGPDKALTEQDRAALAEATDLCKEILRGFGANGRSMFLGTLNAGHPGGMLPLTPHEAESLHHRMLPANLYVADATLLPRSLGNPPMLTIMALAKAVARRMKEIHS